MTACALLASVVTSAAAAVLAALVWAIASSLLRELRISAFEAPLSSLAWSWA